MISPGAHETGWRWVFKLKLQQGKLIFKARLIAKGFSQIKSVNYKEIFSPVGHLASVPLLFAMAAVHNWEIVHYDVNSAFLQGELDKPVYLAKPIVY